MRAQRGLGRAPATEGLLATGTVPKSQDPAEVAAIGEFSPPTTVGRAHDEEAIEGTRIRARQWSHGGGTGIQRLHGSGGPGAFQRVSTPGLPLCPGSPSCRCKPVCAR